jgi:hypothetical protein
MNGKDVGPGAVRGAIWDTISTFAWREWIKPRETWLRIVDAPAEIVWRRTFRINVRRVTAWADMFTGIIVIVIITSIIIIIIICYLATKLALKSARK